MTNLPSVLLVEDHQLLLVGLRISLERLNCCKILGEAADGEAAVREAQRLRPDIVLMDVGLPGIDGVEATWQIKHQLPKTHVIMFTSHTSNDDISAALGAGADGYCSKDAPVEQVRSAMNAAMLGEVWLDPHIVDAIVTKNERHDDNASASLTKLELQILALIKDGNNNSEIASQLNVSSDKVNREMHNIIHRFAKEKSITGGAGNIQQLDGKRCSTEWLTASENVPEGRVFADKYLIEHLIGNGGVGAVFKAKHLFIDRPVALKLLHPELAENRLAMRNFQREAKSVAKLRHENIVGLHDFGISESGEPYLVMEYVDGTNLADILLKEPILPLDRVIKLSRQVCAGLAEAHSKSIIHCDLKPSNILVLGSPPNETVKLVDFGIAEVMPRENKFDTAITAKFFICGTPIYMSPEQCFGNPLDERSDIYSLGCIMYEALTGKTIFLGKTVMETFSKQCEFIAPPMSAVCGKPFSPNLEKCVSSMLAKDPAMRPQSVQEVMILLDSV